MVSAFNHGAGDPDFRIPAQQRQKDIWGQEEKKRLKCGVDCGPW